MIAHYKGVGTTRNGRDVRLTSPTIPNSPECYISRVPPLQFGIRCQARARRIAGRVEVSLCSRGNISSSLERKGPSDPAIAEPTPPTVAALLRQSFRPHGSAQHRTPAWCQLPTDWRVSYSVDSIPAGIDPPALNSHLSILPRSRRSGNNASQGIIRRSRISPQLSKKHPTHRRADEGHGEAPGQQLIEEAAGVHVRGSGGDAEGTDGRQRRDVD
jgi:hypothetical protein